MGAPTPPIFILNPVQKLKFLATIPSWQKTALYDVHIPVCFGIVVLENHTGLFHNPNRRLVFGHGTGMDRFGFQLFETEIKRGLHKLAPNALAPIRLGELISQFQGLGLFLVVAPQPTVADNGLLIDTVRNPTIFRKSLISKKYRRTVQKNVPFYEPIKGSLQRRKEADFGSKNWSG